jgi:hypothetical protein
MLKIENTETEFLRMVVVVYFSISSSEEFKLHFGDEESFFTAQVLPFKTMKVLGVGNKN